MEKLTFVNVKTISQLASRVPTLPNINSTYNAKLTNIYNIYKNTKKKLKINTKTFAEQLSLINDRIKTKLCIHFTKATYKTDEVIT